MFFVKKKKSDPPLFALLDDAAERSKYSYFYYPLFDREIENAKKWCLKNKYTMSVDFIREGDVFYKFVPNT